MSQGPIPSQWPDMTAWSVGYVTPQQPDATVATVKPSKLPNGQKDTRALPPYRQIIISSVTMQKITEVSRNFLITAECWAVNADGVPQVRIAKELASEVGFLLESAPRNQAPVISAEINSGPTELRDEDTKLTYFEVAVMVTARRLP